MARTSFRRRTIGGAIAVTLVAPLAVLFFASSASADIGDPERVVESTPTNTDSPKSITATCPDGQYLASPGGRVVGGFGDVVLTGIVPDATARSVTVYARLRPLVSPRPWSLTAYAVCNDAVVAPMVVPSPPSTTMSALASCPGDGRVFGAGFQLTGGGAYIDRVEPNPALTDVLVSGVKSPAASVTLTAYAVCHPTTLPVVERIESSAVLDGTWPKTATVQDTSAIMQVYGVGGRINSATPGILLDGLIPAPDTNQAHAQANRMLPPTSPLRLDADAMADAVAVDPDDVTVYATDIGTFC
jgi:hypothetical protein